MENLVYKPKPISSIRSLSWVLKIPEDELLVVASNIEKHYRKNEPKIKPDGRERITYRLSKKLKFIQKRINRNIFYQVEYPIYLQGSIRDKSNPRTYDGNASIHAGSNLIVSEDVSDFFHSIDEKHVRKMWKYLFGFSNEVADLLTRLTTYNEYVPQGGVTSSYIANLVLFDLEPELVTKLNLMGLRYTRYIDDVTLSSKSKWLDKDILQKAIKSVYVMLATKGFKPNRRKHQIMCKSVRMVIHKLNVNSGKPTMDNKRRQRLRLEIYNLIKFAKQCNRRGGLYKKRHISLAGKVKELTKFHVVQGKKHAADLKHIKPL